MNKSTGAAVGAILLAGAMFRSGGTPSPQPTGQSSTASIVNPALKPHTGEGPWLASCKYWTSARWDKPSFEGTSPEPHNGATGSDSRIAASKESTTDCEREGDGWGIPSSETDHQPEIHAIIATVPDPIHSHLALEFDRTIDALMQAAADNRFLGSLYWLPWKGHSASTASAEPSATPTQEDLTREQQPGLIILKYSPRGDEKDAAWSGYHRVIYLFLVAETPALGMNGTQLRNALRYEAQLQTKHRAQLSMEGQDRLAIIGPTSSGSAASLREGIEKGIEKAGFTHPPSEIIVAGETSTGIASVELNAPLGGRTKLTYVSFAENSGFELTQFFSSLYRSYDASRLAILIEDGTTFGDASLSAVKGSPIIRFPREISLLRNAQTDQTGKSSATAVPSPYLNLSLKDPNADDTVPHFSTAQTPLSQEAQLMAIARQLQRNRTQFILISGSNILDELFLAQFLRRACPDARLVFYNGGDLLIERDIDNQPYIGSIVVTPYTLIDLDNTRAFSDSHAERVYNAASYVFWIGSREWKRKEPPNLAGYQPDTDGKLVAPLWATAVGSDGYYPLGILNPCASDSASILPNIVNGAAKPCVASDASFSLWLTPGSRNAAPSLLWFVLCALITCLCVGHAVVMRSAEYWSPFTRDLAVDQNDQPRRRSVYINIGTSVLFSMAFVVAFPLLVVAFPLSSTDRFYLFDIGSLVIASFTLLAGLVALFVTLKKTFPYAIRSPGLHPESPTSLYPYFNLIALTTVIAVPLLWTWICLRKVVEGSASYVGLFFSYRSLHPGSGVSPVIPILLLLFSWYLWAIFQTARLRFSTMSRPRLPDRVPSKSPYPLFVSDSDLALCETPIHSCLFQNVTCLLITREIIRRFTRWSPIKLNRTFFLIYLVLFAMCVFCGRIQSLEHFLLHPPRLVPTAYEFLIAALFFPLIMIAFTGWLRMIFVWGSLNRGLLEPLERVPLRFAFTRLKEVGWVTMLSQSSLHIRWRDMARSTESVRQLINNPGLAQAVGDQADWKQLTDTYDDLMQQIMELRKRIGSRTERSKKLQPQFESHQSQEFPPDDDDLPEPAHRDDLCFIYAIEKRYAAFCGLLLSLVLIPYWDEKRIGFVEEHEGSTESGKPQPVALDEPIHIRLTEELLAIRYVALIRSVLVNIRFLMIFVSSAFVFAIIAWNSYPFQPHQLIDWCFTFLLVFLGCGFIWVFAQMHRNPILSRITDTKPNELGIAFFIRIGTFGAIPFLTWLAYQFPDIGGSLLKLLQPSLQVMK